MTNLLALLHLNCVKCERKTFKIKVLILGAEYHDSVKHPFQSLRMVNYQKKATLHGYSEFAICVMLYINLYVEGYLSLLVRTHTNDL